MHPTDCIHLRQSVLIPCKLYVSKHLMRTFPNSFSIFITYCQHTIIISLPSSTNVLISFGHPRCNLTFLIFSPISTCKSIYLWFIFDLQTTAPFFPFGSRYTCDILLDILICVFLFLLFQSLHSTLTLPLISVLQSHIPLCLALRTDSSF